MAGPQITYILSGGPCDGKVGQITSSTASSGQLVCQQHLYKRGNPPVITGGHVVFKDAGVVAKPPPAVPAPKFHSGWHHLSRTMHTQWSQSVSEARRNTREALRTVGGGRKVGR